MASGSDPLAGLRGLHTPPPPGWWPPAPGWWVLAALAVAAVITAVVMLIRRHRRAKPVRSALAELDTIFAELEGGGDDRECVQSVSTLLKRVALVRYSRVEVAALSGEQWVTFLQNTAPRGADPAAVEPLVRVHSTRVEVDGAALRGFSRRWLRAHRIRGRRRADV